VLLFSCKHYKIHGELVNKTSKKLVIPYFDELNYEYHYTAKINAFDNSFNGVLIVKKVGTSHKRVVLITDFGNTLFDFEYRNGERIAKYIVDDLNKKLILNKLLLYFEFLTRSEYFSRAEYQMVGGKLFVSDLRFNRVTIMQKEHLQHHQELMSRCKHKAELTFFSSNNYADSISLISKELPINMFFKKRTKQINADQ